MPSTDSFSANMRASAGQPRRPNAWAKYNLGMNWARRPGVVGNSSRRATFADRGHADVVPVTAGSPPATRSSEPGVTFFAKPVFRDDELFSHVLQSPYPTGLQAAFFDGSVRFLRAGIGEQAFWGLVTRDGGEVVGDD